MIAGLWLRFVHSEWETRPCDSGPHPCRKGWIYVKGKGGFELFTRGGQHAPLKSDPPDCSRCPKQKMGLDGEWTEGNRQTWQAYNELQALFGQVPEHYLQDRTYRDAMTIIHQEMRKIGDITQAQRLAQILGSD